MLRLFSVSTDDKSKSRIEVDFKGRFHGQTHVQTRRLTVGITLVSHLSGALIFSARLVGIKGHWWARVTYVIIRPLFAAKLTPLAWV